jgi:hypothetical protein
MYSGEYVRDISLSVYPHRASLKNMPDHGGNRTYDLWNLPYEPTLSNLRTYPIESTLRIYPIEPTT